MRPAPAVPGRSAGSQEAVRQHNLGRLLRRLHVEGAVSRADLTAGTGLNRSTVKALTEDLVGAGLVRESAPVGRGAAGRPSIVVQPAQDVHVVALDVGVQHVTAVRVGLGGVVLDRLELRQSQDQYAVPRTVERLDGLVRALLDGAPAASRCLGVGVGVCGVVDAEQGVVRVAPNLGWVDVPLGDLLAERLAGSAADGLPVRVGNEGDLGALAEHLRGAGRGVDDLVYVSGEVGVGGGIIVGGRPLRGAGGYAGEIGHMSVDVRGKLCRCGRRGCWETEISGEAVLSATGAPDGMMLEDVLAAHAAGERWTRAGMRRVARGGQVQLAVAELGDDSVAVGAAELGFARLLREPLEVLADLPVPSRAGARA